MALAAVTTIESAPGPDGAARAHVFDLGSLTTATDTDHVDTLGYAGRFYVVGINGATNSATFELQGSHDGTTFSTLTGTSGAVAADEQRFVFMGSGEVPRYVRVTVTTANANGTDFHLYMERH